MNAPRERAGGNAVLDERPAPATSRSLGVSAIDGAWALGLALATLAVFSRALVCDFVEFDDNVYVTRNAGVQAGLSWTGWNQAWTAVVGSNWHPLTMLSHGLDWQLFGPRPWGHHLTSIVWHGLTAAAVYLLWVELTGRRATSLALAALWAWHPLRVESVVWVAERKDVLSGCLGIATLWAYARWARGPSPGRFALVTALFALGLTAKSMLVTLPVIMLLLDYWPLERWRSGNAPGSNALTSGRALAFRLVREKWAWIGLSALFCLIALSTQSQVAMRTLGKLPLAWRAANAAVAVVDYLGQLVWPNGLACFYPHPVDRLPWGQAIVAAVAIVVCGLLAWRERAVRPYLLVGCSWYLVMLLPVIGLVQVGGHARADRYTYLPQIGIWMLLLFGLDELLTKRVRWRAAGAAIVVAGLAGLACITWRQTGVWQNSESLFRRATEVTEGNFFAHAALGNALAGRSEFEQALAEYDRALALRPADPLATVGKGMALAQLGRNREAMPWLELAVEADPYNPRLRFNTAEVGRALGENRAARKHYDAALAAVSALLGVDPGAAALEAQLRARRQDLPTDDTSPR